MTQEEDIRRAVEVLRKGGVILYPTDTVWGIGCDATIELEDKYTRFTASALVVSHPIPHTVSVG